jgi:hypothetical protein
MGRLMLSLLVGCVAYMLIIAVFAPWGFFLGGHIHVLPVWHGIGHLKASSGDYVLYFWMSPAPGGRTYNYPYFRGWGYLCTPRGERYSLRATGSLHEHTGIDTNGKEMHLEFHRRPWNWAWTGGWDRRPRLDLSGQWRDAELVMDDGGTLSQAFLPDGTLYQGSPHSQPKVREKLHVAFQETPWTAWFADCRAK